MVTRRVFFMGVLVLARPAWAEHVSDLVYEADSEPVAVERNVPALVVAPESPPDGASATKVGPGSGGGDLGAGRQPTFGSSKYHRLGMAEDSVTRPSAGDLVDEAKDSLARMRLLIAKLGNEDEGVRREAARALVELAKQPGERLELERLAKSDPSASEPIALERLSRLLARTPGVREPHTYRESVPGGGSHFR